MGTGDDMTVAAFIEALDERGIELWFEGARLRFRAPQGAVSAPLRAELAARREEIVAHLRAKAMGSKAISPLSFSQRSLWISHQQTPESAAYHVAMPMEICSHLDLPALLQALQALVDRHGALRTTYDTVDGEPVQLVAGAHPPKLEIHDVVDVADAKLRLIIEKDYRRPFDLVQGPVFRTSLFTRRSDSISFCYGPSHRGRRMVDAAPRGGTAFGSTQRRSDRAWPVSLDPITLIPTTFVGRRRGSPDRIRSALVILAPEARTAAGPA